MGIGQSLMMGSVFTAAIVLSVIGLAYVWIEMMGWPGEYIPFLCIFLIFLVGCILSLMGV